jgi:hypothetical protein
LRFNPHLLRELPRQWAFPESKRWQAGWLAFALAVRLVRWQLGQIPMRRLRVSLLTSLLLGLALGACYREASDATLSARPRYTGTEAWSVDDIRPGQGFEEVKARLGEPTEVRELGGKRSASWKHGQLTALFEEGGRAVEVSGQSIRAGGSPLIRVGAAEAEVVQVLGPGEVQRVKRPKGSGVISVGSEHTHTMHLYTNGGVRFEVSVSVPNDSVVRIWARFPPPAKR